MIPPALSAAEWATKDFQFDHWGAAQLHSTGEVTVRDVNEPSIFKGDARLKMAALCLHGRISWDMVDALRSERSWAGDLIDNVADLLESLLPPRTI